MMTHERSAHDDSFWLKCGRVDCGAVARKATLVSRSGTSTVRPTLRFGSEIGCGRAPQLIAFVDIQGTRIAQNVALRQGHMAAHLRRHVLVLFPAEGLGK